MCYVNLRKGVSKLNFVGFLLLHIPFLFLLLGSSLLFTLLIEDPRYFHIPPTQTSGFIGNASVVSSVVSLFVTQLAGMLYDVLGRRAVITAASAVGGLTMTLIPYCSNLVPEMLLAKIVVMNCGLVLVLQPLLIDYVRQESKGLAAGISSLVAGVAKILLLSVELPLTSSLPIYSNFQLNGGVALLFSIFFFFSISDLYFKEEKQHLPCCQ